MKNQTRLLSVLLFSLAFASGCEHDGGATSTDQFSITPATAELTPGDTVVLTAVGGHSPFTWTVDDSTAGEISSTNGESVTYMAIRAVPLQTDTGYTNGVGGVPERHR